MGEAVDAVFRIALEKKKEGQSGTPAPTDTSRFRGHPPKNSGSVPVPTGGAGVIFPATSVVKSPPQPSAPPAPAAPQAHHDVWIDESDIDTMYGSQTTAL